MAEQRGITSCMGREYKLSLIMGIIVLIVGATVNFLTGHFADTKASEPVGDIVLDNLPLVDVNWFFTYGFLVAIILIIILAFVYKDHAPFGLKAIGLLLLIRGIAITLTHIGQYPICIDDGMNTTILRNFYSNADLFFSGHASLPFMVSLIFLDKKFWHYLFLAASILMAFSALLLKVHYSIDIVGAFFITYGVYRMAKYIFKKDVARAYGQ